MSHRNARLTVHGHLLLVERVRVQGMAIAHVAKAMGISRQCAHRWVARFDAEGAPGLAGPVLASAPVTDPDSARGGAGRARRPRRASSRSGLDRSGAGSAGSCAATRCRTCASATRWPGR